MATLQEKARMIFDWVEEYRRIREKQEGKIQALLEQARIMERGIDPAQISTFKSDFKRSNRPPNLVVGATQFVEITMKDGTVHDLSRDPILRRRVYNGFS